MPSFHLVLSLESSLVFYLGSTSLCSHFGCLFVFVSMYYYWSAITSSLCELALCSRCPVTPSGAVWITWVGCSRDITCVGHVASLVVIESWMLVTCLYRDMILRLADSWAQLWPWFVTFCVGCDYTKQNSPQQCSVPTEISLWICCMWSLLDSPLLFSGYVCIDSELLDKDSGAVHCHTLWVTGPRQPTWSSFDEASSINPSVFVSWLFVIIVL